MNAQNALSTTVKRQLITDIQNIDNAVALMQLFEFMKLVKQNVKPIKSNPSWLDFAGCMSDEQANDMRKIIEREFNNIDSEFVLN